MKKSRLQELAGIQKLSEMPAGNAQTLADIKALAKIGVNVAGKKSALDGPGLGNWLIGSSGRGGKYKIQIKRFDEPSQFGINNSRVSKLYIVDPANGRILANFERGWDVKPTDPDVKKLIGKITKVMK